MRVREDTIERQDGSPGIYGVVEKTDFAVIVPLDHGLIHLVEQYRYPVQGRYWELPQGSWEDAPGTDPLELARAELREETGLTAESMIHVGHLFECYGYSTQGYHIYLAQGLHLGEAQREPTEQDMVSRAFSVEEVLAMITEGVIKDATTVAALGMLWLKGVL
ncbi:NUDIX hydrolase [Microvirga sp. BT688]|uniref:NUDIX domain-containing protein n=1 Tax=Microvirga sp. TaxID=1873136 RepID=UPI0016826264|nr:NUDIX hydrolase [Microvirga sp.]